MATRSTPKRTNAPVTPSRFLRTAYETLNVDYEHGDVTHLGTEHTTGWRVYPWLVLSQPLDAQMHLLFKDSSMMAKSGELMCIPPGVPHCINKVSVGPSVSRWSHIRIMMFGTMEICSLLRIPSVVSGREAYAVGDICEELAKLNTIFDAEAGSSLGFKGIFHRKALMLSLAEIIVRISTPDERLARIASNVGRLAPLLEHIEQHFHQPLTREALAQLVHLSPSRMTAIFTDAIGVAPSEYIQQRRLSAAQMLLLNSEMSVSQVAAQCGYPDAFHFSRTFKKQFGLSPLSYRKTTLVL